MAGRWRILALLFAVRTAMAFQFQSVSALAPLIRQDFGIGLADIGLLIALYLAPGIVLAWPGGDIGRRFGDKPVVIAGLLAMLAGALLMAMSASWQVQLAGRLLAGVGGVLLNVLMSKMVTDWFAGREIATAMGIFVNSWPVGIALALVALPPVAALVGLVGAHLFTAALVAVGLVALAAFYRAPASQSAAPARGQRPTGIVLYAVLAAGAIWGLFNAAISMVFSFGPTMLVEQGWSLAAASSTTSIVLWLAGVSVPLGGVLADRSGRPDIVMLGGFLAFAALLLLATRIDAVVPTFVAIGLFSGLPAGAIMSLPARVLAPDKRASGMGLFYTLFYAFVVAAPWIGGWLASQFGTALVTFDAGALMLLLACVAMLAFQWLAANVVATRVDAARA